MEKNIVKAGTARISVPAPMGSPHIMRKMAKGSVMPSAHGRKLSREEQHYYTNPKPKSLSRKKSVFEHLKEVKK